MNIRSGFRLPVSTRHLFARNLVESRQTLRKQFNPETRPRPCGTVKRNKNIPGGFSCTSSCNYYR